MPDHPLNDFEIWKYYQNNFKFNSLYSRNNLHKIYNETHVIHLNEYISMGTHWIASYINSDNVTYFGSFGVELFLKEIKTFIGNKSITTNIYRI